MVNPETVYISIACMVIDKKTPISSIIINRLLPFTDTVHQEDEWPRSQKKKVGVSV